MSQRIEIPAELREKQGKGASRRLRREGLVPGIVYGGGKDPACIQIPQTYLRRALGQEAFYTSILEIKAGEKRQKVVLRDLQRHPYKPEIVHVDFQRISDTETIRMMVPLHFMNEESSPAGKMSGVVVSHQVNEVEISCLPKDLPEYIEVDLSDMDVGDIVQMRDIPLPDGVTLTAEISHDEMELDRAVVTAQHITIPKITEEAPEAEGEVPATEVGEAEEGEAEAEAEGAESEGEEAADDES